MDYQLLTAIKAFTEADFMMLFGRAKGVRLFPAFQTAAAADKLQSFLIELSDEDRKHMADVARIKLSKDPILLEGTYVHLHAVLGFLRKNAAPYLIVVSEKVITPGMSDWSIYMSHEDYKAFQHENTDAA